MFEDAVRSACSFPSVSSRSRFRISAGPLPFVCFVTLCKPVSVPLSLSVPTSVSSFILRPSSPVLRPSTMPQKLPEKRTSAQFHAQWCIAPRNFSLFSGLFCASARPQPPFCNRYVSPLRTAVAPAPARFTSFPSFPYVNLPLSPKTSAHPASCPNFCAPRNKTTAPIIPPAQSRLQKCKPNPCNDFRRPPRHNLPSFWRFTPVLFLFLARAKNSAAGNHFTAIRHNQMRKDATTPLSHLHCNVHPHRHLRSPAAQSLRESLRKIRDLIIFRENSVPNAQWPASNVSREISHAAALRTRRTRNPHLAICPAPADGLGPVAGQFRFGQSSFCDD